MARNNPFRSIGEIYLDSPFFSTEDDPAAETIGQPIVGDDFLKVVQNRRKVKGRVNDAGANELKKVVAMVKDLYPDNQVKLTWDRFCGCSMCPCSPGYRIKVDSSFISESNKKTRFSLHVSKKSKGTEYTFFKPKDSWSIGYDKVDKLQKAFLNERKIGV